MPRSTSPPIRTLSPVLSVFLLDALHPSPDTEDSGGVNQRVTGLGNKYYKLRPNLAAAKNSGFKTLVTFGGAWSNHIYATAMVGKQQGLTTVGVIRGERPDRLSATLNDASHWGMHLEFVSRAVYKRGASPHLLQTLRDQYGEFYLLPEGGSNTLAIQGSAQIVSDLNQYRQDYDLLVLPVGTGGTLAGVVMGLNGRARVLGISVLKGGNFLHGKVQSFLNNLGCDERNWSINQEFHCGGYARCPDELKIFILDFENEHQIPLDPVYTGKMMFAIDRLRSNGLIAANTKVVAIHTGGLQGRRGFDF